MNTLLHKLLLISLSAQISDAFTLQAFSVGKSDVIGKNNMMKGTLLGMSSESPSSGKPFEIRDDLIDDDDELPQQTKSKRPIIDAEIEDEMSSSGEEGSSLCDEPWESLHGNFILRPPSQQQPRALIHFLGGAVIGAAPDLSYRYILEKLAQNGYLIVATPFNLSFDYLTTCDTIIEKFERVAPMLAREYGGIPVVGVGHSCGALLQLLITSLFPDTPRAANALISYNNMDVKNAVPLFDEIVSPFFEYVATSQGNNSGGRTGIQVLQTSLKVTRTALQGQEPSDHLLNDFLSDVVPIMSVLSENAVAEDFLKSSLKQTLSSIEDITNLTTDATPLSKAYLLRLIDILDQIPLLIKEVGQDKVREFTPTQDQIEKAAKRAYRARRTLILKYSNDGFDESDKIFDSLTEAEELMRVKRPEINIDLQYKTIEGGIHASPVLAPPGIDVAKQAEELLGEDAAKSKLLFKQADDTVELLLGWLEEAAL